MTFVRPLAIHNITIPASANLQSDRLAALYALWNGVSTNWVATLPVEIDTASPGPGSYSFALSRIGAPTNPQFNLRMDGTTAAPGTKPYLGINPDGSTDPILDSESPAGPANFYEKSIWTIWGNYKNLLVFEFDDAIAVCCISDGGTVCADVIHFGEICTPRWVDDTAAGAAGLRIGLGAFGGAVQAGGNTSWFDSSTNAFCRQALGTLAGDDGPGQAWYNSTFPDGDILIGTTRTEGFTNFGPNNITRFARTRFKTLYHVLGEWKYVRYMPASYPLEQFITVVDGKKWFLCIGNHATASYIWLPVTENYDPFTPGVYT